MYRYLAGVVTGMLLVAWAVLVAMTSDIQVILIISAFFALLTTLFNVFMHWVIVRYAVKADA